MYFIVIKHNNFLFCLLSALADRFADIFFLVDSGITQSYFSMFKSDLNKLINQLNVGVLTYRIGLAQYDQDTKVEFLLNAHPNKQDTLGAVRRFRLRPQPHRSRHLGNALQYASAHFFTPEAGGRAHLGSRQFLVVVTGRESDDHVSRIAQKIKSEGITIVGMSAGASKAALERFASDGYAFLSFKLTLLKDSFMTEREDSIITGEKDFIDTIIIISFSA